MSAIREEGADAEPIRVLFTLHNNMNAIDFVGTLEVLSSALNDVKDEEDKAFDCEFVGDGEHVMSSSGTSFRSHVTYQDAYKQLKDYDVLVVAGGNAEEILKSQAEPLGLIRAFADLQEHNSSKERTILSVDTGSLFLANQGILQGLAATTHPEHYIKLELLAQESAQKELETRTEVMEGERYVVNQGRFDLGDNLNENPYVYKRGGRKMSEGGTVRKGSEARKMSNARRESIIRRSAMRLGGMRVITAAGSTCGIDAALYLVSALVSHESAQNVSDRMQYSWQKGVVVDSIDV